MANTPPRNKIRLLYGIPTVILFLLLTSSAVIHLVLSEQTYEDQVRLAIHDSKQLMLLMKRSTEAFVRQDISEDLEHLLSSINDHEHLEYFRYITGDGKIRYSSIFYEINETLSNSEMSILSDIDLTTMKRYDTEEFFVIYMPVRDIRKERFTKVGMLIGRFDTHHVQRIVEKKMIHSFINSVMVIFVITFILFAVLYFTLDRPIRSIKRSIKHLARKQYDVDIQDSIWSEFADLAYHGNKARDLLKQADAYEKQQQKYKDQFVASVSHELRTPLNGILGLTNLLVKQNPNSKKSKTIQKIHLSAQMLLDVVNEILDYSKIQSGKFNIELIPVDIQTDFNHVFSVLTHLAHNKDIDFHIFIDPNIRTRVLSDPLRLQQVINNLCSNAIKFTNQGKVVASIDIEDESVDSLTLHFKFMDTGIGISDDALPHLFEAFKQSDDSVTRQYGGTGLGLFISQQIVKALGGHIEVESRLGGGSTFEFTLTMKKTGSDTQEVISESSLDLGYLAKKRLLIVDDNLINLEVASTLLSDYFNSIDTVESGQDAIHAAMTVPYDLILMDIQMPGMSGIEAMKQIRDLEGYQNTCILALTANVMKKDVQNYMEEGFDDVQSKPFKVEDLVEKIQRCLLKEK
ncbi:response regulator [Bermanella marisrubri]|uniref:histidine kinase n=1 Tax=Bermanella marisrubri TaxID=207949 RepID=Q1MXL9_9GAMM|nr:ATP-binding protein [Bermanella marisrubri]EAT10714.1 Response regulator receiver:ATP-binding region, ATPase-like:Histidine kinase, HAMP region:Histidine [Oceanobacter sp. RED65] [Bermanella marisrubri]QIZ83876.1 response regulator [Bermanella marisrubri]